MGKVPRLEKEKGVGRKKKKKPQDFSAHKS